MRPITIEQRLDQLEQKTQRIDADDQSRPPVSTDESQRNKIFEDRAVDAVYSKATNRFRREGQQESGRATQAEYIHREVATVTQL